MSELRKKKSRMYPKLCYPPKPDCKITRRTPEYSEGRFRFVGKPWLRVSAGEQTTLTPVASLRGFYVEDFHHGTRTLERRGD